MRIITILLLCWSSALFAQQRESSRLFEISPYFPVQQSGKLSGSAFFVDPFLNPLSVHASTRFVFGIYEYHLAVLEKESQTWTIYSIADGYRQLTAGRFKIHDYRDAFVIRLTQEPRAVVFDKKTRLLKPLDVDESWPKFLQSLGGDPKGGSSDGKWTREFFSITHHRPDGTRFRYQSFYGDFNHVRKLLKVNDEVWSIGPSFVRRYSNPQSWNLLEDHRGIIQHAIHNVQRGKNHVLIIERNKVFRYRYRSRNKLHLLNVLEIPPNTTIVDFNQDYLFYANGAHLYIKSWKTRSLVQEYRFNARIQQAEVINDDLVLFTGQGVSIVDGRTFSPTHFLNSKLYQDLTEEELALEHSEGSYEYYLWKSCWTRFCVGRRIVETSEAKAEVKRFLVFDLKRRKPSALERVFSKKLRDQITLNVDIEKRGSHLAISQDKKVQFFKIRGSKQELLSTVRLKRAASRIPNVFMDESKAPVGTRVTDWLVHQNMLWLATDEGLFSQDLRTKAWKSHYVGQFDLPHSYPPSHLLVTDDFVFVQGARDSRKNNWTRIDRRNFIRLSYHNMWENRFGTVKEQNNRVVFASENGIGMFDLSTHTYKLFPTPSPVWQVTFMGSDYIAAAYDALYQINAEGMLIKTYPLSPSLPSEFKASRHRILVAEGPWIWMAAGEVAIAFNTKTAQMTKVYKPPTEIDEPRPGDIVQILIDNNDIWIVRERQLERIERRSRNKSVLGTIAKKSVRRDWPTLGSILGVADSGTRLLLSSTYGLFSLDKSSLTLERNSHHLLQRELGRVVKHKGTYFLPIEQAILQIDENSISDRFHIDKSYLLVSYDELEYRHKSNVAGSLQNLYDSLQPRKIIYPDLKNIDARHKWAQEKWGKAYSYAVAWIKNSPFIRKQVGEPLQIAPVFAERKNHVGQSTSGFDKRIRINARFFLDVQGPRGKGLLELKFSKDGEFGRMWVYGPIWKAGGRRVVLDQEGKN